jgi:hypothetical protein
MALPDEFKALVVTETQDNQFVRSIEQKKIDDLPKGTGASPEIFLTRLELMLPV